jgi:hypothetical protein
MYFHQSNLINLINKMKFTFDSEKLVVDWISFKFQSLEKKTQIQIANYLFKIGFNCYQESGKLVKPIKEPLLVNSKNKFEVIFVKEGPYWEGTILQFSGINAAFFYILIKQKLIYWELFSSATLGRFDLYYSRTKKIEDKISVRDFLQNCQKKLKQKNVGLEKNRKGWILKVGSRRSNNYSRIYETQNSLKFEHEMKGKIIQQYYLLLVENDLEEFEQKLSSHFLICFGKLLPLNYSYLDWLVIKLCPIAKQPSLQCCLNSDYIKSEISVSTKTFVMLLQF